MTEKVCTIVGMGPGIGMGVAQRFAREGYAIGMIARNEAKLQSQQPLIDAQTAIATADASDEVALRAAIDHIHGQLGPTSVLLYNAALMVSVPPSQLVPEDFVQHLRINLVGALAAAQQCLPAMREAHSGTILLTGGGLAIYPSPQYASLAAAKAALRNLTNSLYQELKPEGIHVATVIVAGGVQEGTYFDPNNIAEVFWQLHAQAPDDWQHEVIYAKND